MHSSPCEIICNLPTQEKFLMAPMVGAEQARSAKFRPTGDKKRRRKVLRAAFNECDIKNGNGSGLSGGFICFQADGAEKPRFLKFVP